MTTIFTTATGIYNSFIPLFVASHLYWNEDCVVEVHATNPPDLPLRNCLVPILEKRKGVSDNSLRFLIQPYQKSEYVYISDIDVICMESITDKHKAIADKRGYSNMVRKNHDVNRMTGLHFSRWEKMYPIEAEGLSAEHDECLLFELVARKNIIDFETDFRPVHGIHASPNRKPLDEVGWELDGWKGQWMQFKESAHYQAVRPFFDERCKEVINTIDKIYECE